MKPASIGRRFIGLLVDWIMCLLIGSLFGPLDGSVWPLAVLVVEYTFFIGLFAQTPGMFVVRLQCVAFDAEPERGRPIGLPRAALRALLLALVIPALIMNADRRGLHDRAAGSIVVQPAG